MNATHVFTVAMPPGNPCICTIEPIKGPVYWDCRLRSYATGESETKFQSLSDSSAFDQAGYTYNSAEQAIRHGLEAAVDWFEIRANAAKSEQHIRWLYEAALACAKARADQ